MRAFADLLSRLSFTASRNAKLTLVREFLRRQPDPERGWGLAALTGDLVFHAAKPAMIRKAVEARMDPILFGWSYDYVGDLAETVALVWPVRRDQQKWEPVLRPAAPSSSLTRLPSGEPVSTSPEGARRGSNREPELSEVVDGLRAASRTEVTRLLEHWLDALDADGRWALLKLMTGALRVGLSARLAKQALANRSS